MNPECEICMMDVNKGHMKDCIYFPEWASDKLSALRAELESALNWRDVEASRANRFAAEACAQNKERDSARALLAKQEEVRDQLSISLNKALKEKFQSAHDALDKAKHIVQLETQLANTRKWMDDVVKELETAKAHWSNSRDVAIRAESALAASQATVESQDWNIRRNVELEAGMLKLDRINTELHATIGLRNGELAASQARVVELEGMNDLLTWFREKMEAIYLRDSNNDDTRICFKDALEQLVEKYAALSPAPSAAPEPKECEHIQGYPFEVTEPCGVSSRRVIGYRCDCGAREPTPTPQAENGQEKI